MNADEKKIRLQELANKWLNGTLTDVEQLEFDSWFIQPSTKPLDVPADVAENKEQYRQLIFSRIRKEIGTKEPAKPHRLWPRIAIAAAVATVIVSAGIWFLKREDAVQPTETVVANDVAPGRVGATLTLASGKTIHLSDATKGELANEAGVSISKSADGRLVYEIKGSDADPDKVNILSTAKGETYQVRLPDGSIVYLNAASSLTYAASLIERGKRVVRLRGEGYFEIFKDKSHPFVVKMDEQEVEVLGTHFNINAYEDEKNIKTTLIEGSVKVNSKKVEQVIKPGQQAVTQGDKISVMEVNTENITDWKDDDFVFNGDDFKSAMRKIARWYDVEIIYADDLPKNISPGGWISRNNKISAVLKMIGATGQVHFKIEGRRILVTK
ncbi:FecR family protein [Pedobacter chinensis]|uniref:FecR family protein n=1 Tax=Pedobacter chinensis TaxID=2282421 RepID=A0A369Q0X6_9SPHI|nr:FecR family protein [Pedobacter chinensis]RDC56656.1 FecR family protein [Pedobacter chinensis]